MSKLLDHAEVRIGHPFRASVTDVVDGPALTVQMRDVSPHGGVAWAGAARIRPRGRKAPDWLRPGDVLFLAHGARNFAVHLDRVPAPALCSQYFFLIRGTGTALLPAFLAWQINQDAAQDYFRKYAEGSAQRSIRRGVLEALPLAVPPLAEQRRWLALAAAAREERQRLEHLIENRERQLRTLAARLLAPTPTPP